MSFNDKENKLAELFAQTWGQPPSSILRLEAQGSDREIYRLSSSRHSAIGIFNSHLDENQAFIGFAKHFKTINLPVPEIFAKDSSQQFYLEEDLGDDTLYKLVFEQKISKAEIEKYYLQAVNYLAQFQIKGGSGLDYSLCYQSRKFDRGAILQDLLYFEAHQLMASGIDYRHEKLLKDFETLSEYLASAPSTYFMYRDFQARNIMVKNGQLFFIDFQSGRLGPLQYDLASLLFQSRLNLPAELRDKLISAYLENSLVKQLVNRDEFMHFFNSFVLIRLLQALGAYGRLGSRPGHMNFVDNVPYALLLLKEQLRYKLPVSIDYLSTVLVQFTDMK